MTKVYSFSWAPGLTSTLLPSASVTATASTFCPSLGSRVMVTVSPASARVAETLTVPPAEGSTLTGSPV